MSDRIHQQIALLKEELDDIDEQVRVGDLDDASATKVRERYVAELDRLMTVLETPLMPEGDRVSVDSASEAPGSQARRSLLKGGRISGRTLTGVAVLAIAMTAIGVFAVQSLTDRRTVGADGVVSDVVRGEGPIDLDSVTNEQMEEIIGENPDVIPMRLALARRYFEGGQFDRALDHYFEVLDREQHPEALANVGWMTYLSDRPDVAVGYVEAALERQPNYVVAQWFLGNIYVSLGRIDEAAMLLMQVASADDVPDDVREAALVLLAQIESDG